MTPKQPNFEITTEPSSADVDALVRGLNEHGAALGRPTEWARFHIRLADEAGAPIGGLAATTAFDWLHINLLFVPKELRGQGLGTRLVQMAEDYARSKGCVGAWLDTFEHQAPMFYTKIGY